MRGLCLLQVFAPTTAGFGLLAEPFSATICTARVRKEAPLPYDGAWGARRLRPAVLDFFATAGYFALPKGLTSGFAKIQTRDGWPLARGAIPWDWAQRYRHEMSAHVAADFCSR